MFIPSALVARASNITSMPQACKPFTLQSNVCVGDLIAIIACSIAGIGFFFWAIHAIRKMRQFPFNYRPEDKVESRNDENERADPYHVPSAIDNSLLVQQGVVRTPSLPERVRTRMVLSQPEEEFHRQSAPISSNAYPTQGSTTAPHTPRRPPSAGGQSRRTSTHRPGRHGSLSRAGPSGERYEYGDQYVRNVTPSRARDSPSHRSGGGYRSGRSMRRMNGEPTMYAY